MSITLARAPHTYRRPTEDEDPRPLDSRIKYPREDAKEEDYAGYTKALWDEQEGPLEPLHQVWIQNLLFLAGLQWWERNPSTGMWGPRKSPRWRRFPVTNLTLPYYKHFVAKLTKQRPAWTAIPASVDSDDIHAARLAEDVLEAKWRELRMAKVTRQALAWLIPTGNAYLYPYWSEETGDVEPLVVEVEASVVDEETGEVVETRVIEVPTNDDGEPRMIERADGSQEYDVDGDPDYYDRGDIACKSLSPFQVRVDPAAESDEEIRWFIVADPRPLDEVKAGYPEYADKIKSDDLGVLGRYDRFVSGLSMGGDSSVVAAAIDRTEEAPQAMVLHYHERPSDDYPRGRYWQTVGDCRLTEPMDLPEGIWPCVVHLREFEQPGQYHGGATMTAVVGLNREYNEITQSILEHHNLLLRGKWLVPRGSMIRKGQITSEPGEIIQHTPGLPPKQADLKPLPAPVYQERERVKSDFQLVSGINKITMGQPPQGVTAGRAFLVLQEADDSDFGPVTEMLEESVADLAWMFLKIIQSNYEEERLVHVVGHDRRYKVRAFKGADLSGVLDVVPQTGSSFPWSQVAKQDLLMQLLQQTPELFVDEETGTIDRHRIARLLPIAGLQSAYASEDMDVNEALREEDLFEDWDGDPQTPLPQIEIWQNHRVHLRSHGRILKSAEFERWTEHAQMAYLQHYEDTRTAVEAEEIRQAMIAQGIDPAMAGEAMMNGGDPGGAGPVPEEGDGLNIPMDPASEQAALREEELGAQERALDQAADAIEKGRIT